MQYYKITIEPESSFGTELQSDTIFGHFCWSYKYKYGEDKLKDILIESSRNNQPAILFSNGFPEDFLPIPVLPEKIDDENLKQNDPKQNDQKLFKKTKYIRKTILNEFRDNYNYNSIFKKYKDHSKKEGDFKSKITKEDIHVHNTINRLTSTTNEEGGLYVKYNHRYDNTKIDIYIAIENELISQKEVFETIYLLFELGYGRDVSTGFGRFVWNEEFIKQNDLDLSLNNIDKYNSIMSLSNFVPDQEMLDKVYDSFYYNLFTKYGKLGGEYATHENPFKKPLLMAEVGATFKRIKDQNLYGRFIEDMHSEKRKEHKLDVYQYAFCFPYPININEDS